MVVLAEDGDELGVIVGGRGEGDAAGPFVVGAGGEDVVALGGKAVR